ncbi:MAG: hypothetical protein M1814_001955 [Vezdaea aestivalis]|nr:MAG: hypothetical protein M1814_001955 [Vezdaea aestivalis]
MTTSKGADTNISDPILLNKIDKLFACGVGDYVDLPQIIVVGDQSSGKSSVLAGILNLPFPRDSGLCTRFPTQITFRRSEKTSISVSIIPAKQATLEHSERLRRWGKSNLIQLDEKVFADIMVEVHAVMGLGGQTAAGRMGTFSEDILKLDINGPDQEHFSVVDVPGIFRKTTEGVTTKEDRDMVNSMVRRYMENPRSVMLTVIPANVDIATQEILSMAEEVDKDGDRTLGVLTKPDLVDKGAERQIMDLIAGKRHALRLGWSLVRNPGQQQIETKGFNRSSAERSFFEMETPWNMADKDRVGIDSLKLRLQEILAEHTRRTFPQVKQELLKKLNVSKKALASLGADRETLEHQRQFLLDTSIRFQEVVTAALNTNYNATDWFDQYPSLRFTTAVVNRNESFADTLDKFGHTHAFISSDPVVEDIAQENGEPTPNTFKCPTEGESSHAAQEQTPITSSGPTEEDSLRQSQEQTPATFKARTTAFFVDLEGIIPEDEEVDAEIGHSIFDWLEGVYKNSRGLGLGTLHSSILSQTMKTQTSRWNTIALGYVSDIIGMTHKFITDLLELVCPEKRVRDALISALTDGLMTRYKKALDMVHFLLRVERAGTPSTLNHYFNDNLEKSRHKRRRVAIEERSFEDSTHGTVIRLADIELTQNMSNLDHVVLEIHDILQAYYKVARKRFVDNVCMQASDTFLVIGDASPLKLFGPAFVNRLSPEQLGEIAGEDMRVKKRRAELAKIIESLEAGRKLLI